MHLCLLSSVDHRIRCSISWCLVSHIRRSSHIRVCSMHVVVCAWRVTSIVSSGRSLTALLVSVIVSVPISW